MKLLKIYDHIDDKLFIKNRSVIKYFLWEELKNQMIYRGDNVVDNIRNTVFNEIDPIELLV
jgi:hypothetical protein